MDWGRKTPIQSKFQVEINGVDEGENVPVENLFIDLTHL